MKTYKHLYSKLHTFDNLYDAFRLARRGKRDRVAVADFELNLEHNLFTLEAELRAQTYQPGSYTNFYIYEPKHRLVSAAPFRDRVVHHALCQIIEPLWETRFIHSNYACRKDKGTHKALDQCHTWIRRYTYAFQGDIVKYFPSIDHQILDKLLSHHIADAKMLWLIRQIMASGAGILDHEYPITYFQGDTLLSMLRPRGLPIGNLSSQFWANVYLHELDMFVKHDLRCSAYLRYMDDFVLFSDDKAQLHAWKAAVTDFLGDRLRLLLHPKKSLVFPVKVGVDFCGFRIYPTHRRLRRSSVRRFVKRFRHQRQAYWQGELSLEDMTTSVRCWIAHANHGATWRLRRRLFKDYPLTP